MKATKLVPTVLAVLLFASVTSAQDRKPLPADEENMYVVSAKIGVLNISEGDVNYKREQADWTRLMAGDELRDGDRVRTGVDSRAEILLTPGCYLRLAENSEFTLTNPHVYQFRIDLTSGSAIIEASTIEGPMTVATPKSEFSIIKEGLYRFNIAADGRAEVIVHKGRIAFGNTTIKEHKKAVIENGQLAFASYDKKRVDSFDTWSQIRALELIALNQQLSRRALSGNATFGFLSNAWVFSRGCSCYTFLPFGSGFSSPYGWGYSVCNPFWYGYDYYNYYPGSVYGWGSGNWGGGRPGTGGSSSGGTGGGTGGGGTGGGHHKPGKGDRVDPGHGLPHIQPPARVDSGPRYNPPSRSDNGSRYIPPSRGDSGPRYNPPSRSDSGPRYSPPSSSGGSSHYSPPPSAPVSMPASTPSNSSSGGGGHRKN